MVGVSGVAGRSRAVAVADLFEVEAEAEAGVVEERASEGALRMEGCFGLGLFQRRPGRERQRQLRQPQCSPEDQQRPLLPPSPQLAHLAELSLRLLLLRLQHPRIQK